MMRERERKGETESGMRDSSLSWYLVLNNGDTFIQIDSFKIQTLINFKYFFFRSREFHTLIMLVKFHRLYVHVLRTEANKGRDRDTARERERKKNC
jgi:hypothetical protein